ncbi:SOS response-associated peptidase [Yoonia sediminilitoris]|uniref:Abasic site processing protein n=1 Tax=Yoonia sediminilitoris TaxID=1286148 RepID=A0A2T6KEN3_9RHOB|nr:SOS response-associated peptidase family protein [Yoonia sediminilitoris]PUB13592.1 putative SOS response-associated peptidase YedK [Yoonia sediminilitoris]RCW94762.1 putative SOS response-associated peptidase YedK [Yoonia sediminilitoris]
MCNLYSMTKNQDAIRALFDGIGDDAGNLPAMSGIYPDYAAPVVANMPQGRMLTKMRWGMPSPAFALKNRNADKGVTNIRNTASPHWRRWLGPDHRCVVPFTAFSEYQPKVGPKWFALNEDQPLAFFAGIWTQWTSVRKVKEGETTDNLFGFLTTEPNGVVTPIHPKAMPVILISPEAVNMWLTAPTEQALRLQRPLPDAMLTLVDGPI